MYTGTYNQNGRFVSESNWVKLAQMFNKHHREKHEPIPLVPLANIIYDY